METEISNKLGLVVEEVEKQKKSGDGTYRLITVDFEDGAIESVICFNDKLEFPVDKSLEFTITKDSYGPKITGVQDAPEGTQLKLSEKKEAKTEVKGHQPELYINLNGKMYVTQAGLLNEAHKKKLKSITTELIEFKDKEIAVVKSIATTEDGKTFTGYGDATKDNVNSMIVKHLLRMAETRATNRSLRLLTNIGVTSIEELGE